MNRPQLTTHVIERLGGLTGVDVEHGVEFRFDVAGADGYYADTLWEDWADRSEAEQTAEMERRYDAWQDRINTPAPPPTPEDVDTQLSNLDDQLLELQRQKVELESQKLAAMEAAPTAEAAATAEA